MVGYIEYFGLEEFYEGLTAAEQNALQQRIPKLLTETYDNNIKGSPGIYVMLSINLSAPPGIMDRMNLNKANIHILADLLERNLDNRSLLNPYRNGDHEFKEREFNYYKCMASRELTGFYFWHKHLLGEDKLHVYANNVLYLYPDYMEHSKLLRIKNLESLVSRLKGYYENWFGPGRKTPSDDPEAHQDYVSKINKFSLEIYELQNSHQFNRDKFFWNYGRFLAIRQRYNEAVQVIERAIELHINHAGFYRSFLQQIRNHHNFGQRDFWSIT